MLYHLFKYFDNVHNLPGAGMFQYISFRAAAAIIIALLIVIVFGRNIINFLRRSMTGNLYQVGQATFGKNVAQGLYTNDQYPQLELWLTTYYLSNSEGYKDYDAEGLPADYTQSESYGGSLGELGTETDPLIQPILVRMATGSFPSTETTTRTLASPRMLIVKNSVADKVKTARITSPYKALPNDLTEN